MSLEQVTLSLEERGIAVGTLCRWASIGSYLFENDPFIFLVRPGSDELIQVNKTSGFFLVDLRVERQMSFVASFLVNESLLVTDGYPLSKVGIQMFLEDFEPAITEVDFASIRDVELNINSTSY